MTLCLLTFTPCMNTPEVLRSEAILCSISLVNYFQVRYFLQFYFYKCFLTALFSVIWITHKYLTKFQRPRSNMCLSVDQQTRITTWAKITKLSSQTKGTSAESFDFVSVSRQCVRFLYNISSLAFKSEFFNAYRSKVFVRLTKVG